MVQRAYGSIRPFSDDGLELLNGGPLGFKVQCIYFLIPKCKHQGQLLITLRKHSHLQRYT